MLNQCVSPGPFVCQPGSVLSDGTEQLLRPAFATPSDPSPEELTQAEETEQDLGLSHTMALLLPV